MAKEMCLLKVLNPAKYFWIANLPGAFDCAEYLFENHYGELNKRQKKAVDAILLKSGKYEE